MIPEAIRKNFKNVKIKIVEWISVNDHMPPQSTNVFVAQYHLKAEWYHISLCYRLKDQWFDTETDSEIDGKHSILTHWMPVPDVPEDQFIEKE